MPCTGIVLGPPSAGMNGPRIHVSLAVRAHARIASLPFLAMSAFAVHSGRRGVRVNHGLSLDRRGFGDAGDHGVQGLEEQRGDLFLLTMVKESCGLVTQPRTTFAFAPVASTMRLMSWPPPRRIFLPLAAQERVRVVASVC
jgi:hypothetical protein